MATKNRRHDRAGQRRRFMTNPAEWNKDIAAEIAKEEGIATDPGSLEGHRLLPRRVEQAGGKSPTLRQITTGTGVQTKELFGLFPRDRRRRSPGFGPGQARRMCLMSAG